MELLTQLGVHWQLLLAQIVNFAILVAVLGFFVYKPLLKLIDERKEKIADEFAGIDRTKGELAKIKEEYQQHLVRIEEEARGKIQQAVAEGRRIASEIEEGARTRNRESLEKAKETIALEVAKAREGLKEQVVDLAIQATHKVLQQHLDEETDRRMIEAFIREVNTLDADAGRG